MNVATKLIESPLVGYVEAARYLGVSEKTLYSMAKSGKIQSVKIGWLVKFKIADLDAYIEKCRREVIAN